MPPKKVATSEKTDDPIGAILAYLAKTNRPYSAADVSTNLKNSVTKAKCDKLLKELAEKEQVGFNDKGGKTSVYWAKQDPDDIATPAELAMLDSQISATRAEIPVLKMQQKAKQAVLSKVLATPTNLVLVEQVRNLTLKKEEILHQLEELKRQGIKRVSVHEKEAAEQEYSKWDMARRKRRKCFAEVEGALMDEGLTRDDLWESCGLDEDPAS